MKLILRILLLALCAAAFSSAQAQTKDATIVNQLSNLCIQEAPPIGNRQISMQQCGKAPAMQNATFNDSGVISYTSNLLNGPANVGVTTRNCLTIVSAIKHGSAVQSHSCTGKLGQLWSYDGTYIRSLNSDGKANGLCLAIKDANKNSDASLDVETCAFNGNQKWTANGVPANWPLLGTVPGVVKGVKVQLPNTAILGAIETQAKLADTALWMMREYMIVNCPFCWKPAGYDRGVGIAANCGSRQQDNDGLCYPYCDPGYTGVGPTCNTKAEATYTPKTVCKHKTLGICDNYVHESCRDNYDRKNIAGVIVCVFKRITYGRGAGSIPSSCNSNRDLQAGLCYIAARSGYSCFVTSCTAECAKGTVSCGPAACANNSGTCAAVISDQVLSTGFMIASLATDGAFGVAAKELMESKQQLKVASSAYDIAQAIILLEGSVNTFMTAAEAHLGTIAPSTVEDQVAAKYPRESANYRRIAREYAALQMAYFLSDTILSGAETIVTVIDPTGISGVVVAFARPVCKQHTKMP
ncbi:ricin-type beta-trefoil lectin domain protein [Oxalobacteraceae bacterium]|nr:ricin-type beta-trefoil lectin domain protein [Oxalobacteraceae bacterium]